MIEQRPYQPGEREEPVELPAEVHRATFEELGAAFQQGEFLRQNEDGSESVVTSYSRYVDPLDPTQVALLTEFRLRAAAGGFKEAFSPLVLPTQSSVHPRRSEAMVFQDNPDRALTLVQFGYERPARQTSPTPPRRR
jgi:hypothetical protein